MAVRKLRIAIASGKGGTGKTTVSTNLAAMFGEPIQLADCDVEEPNTNLFIKADMLTSVPVNMLVPEVDLSRCDGCGQCSDFCQFSAIVSLGSKAIVFPELCHGCGGCALVCPQQAITEQEKQIGTVTAGQSNRIRLIEGRLQVGVSLVPPVIAAVCQQLSNSQPVLLDAPPGTSCPVVATLQECDYVLLVTDPTPFGLHDLKLAVSLVKELGLSAGVVINRYNDDQVGLEDYCQQQQIPILLRIPDSRQVAELVSQGILISQAIPEYGLMFSKLAERIREETKILGEI